MFILGIVKEHEDYWKQLNDTNDYLRKLRVEIQSFSEINNAQKGEIEKKLAELSRFSESLLQGDLLVKKTKEMGQNAMGSTSTDGNSLYNYFFSVF